MSLVKAIKIDPSLVLLKLGRTVAYRCANYSVLEGGWGTTPYALFSVMGAAMFFGSPEENRKGYHLHGVVIYWPKSTCLHADGSWTFSPKLCPWSLLPESLTEQLLQFLFADEETASQNWLNCSEKTLDKKECVDSNIACLSWSMTLYGAGENGQETLSAIALKSHYTVNPLTWPPPPPKKKQICTKLYGSIQLESSIIVLITV